MSRRVVCPNCGRAAASRRALSKYHYEESGLPNVWLYGGVTEVKCTACGETLLRIEKEWQLLQVIAVALLMSPRGMTGSELRFIRGACRMTQAKLASALGISRRETIAVREAREELGLTLAEEIGLRLVLIRGFLARLKEPGGSLLSRDQRKQFTAFANSFVDFAGSMSRIPARGNPRLEASLLSDDWSVTRPRAA